MRIPRTEDFWRGSYNVTQPLVPFDQRPTQRTRRVSFERGQSMQWEYKIVALGLMVDATEPNQRDRHEEILNDLGREGWEAFAYSAQSDTVLLKRPIAQALRGEQPGKSGDPTAETT